MVNKLGASRVCLVRQLPVLSAPGCLLPGCQRTCLSTLRVIDVAELACHRLLAGDNARGVTLTFPLA
jgi:hypothetical protein